MTHKKICRQYFMSIFTLNTSFTWYHSVDLMREQVPIYKQQQQQRKITDQIIKCVFLLGGRRERTVC